MKWMLKDHIARHLKKCISYVDDNFTKDSPAQLRKDSNLLIGKASIPTKMPQEVVDEVKQFFQPHIQALKKPTASEVVPFMAIMDEKYSQYGYTWRDIKDKVWGLIKKEINLQTKTT